MVFYALGVFFLRFLVLSWWISILCVVGELAREGSLAVAVSVGDRGKVTCDMWHLAWAMGHLISTVSKLFETIGKFQVQFDGLSPWPEPMPMLINYPISITLLGNLRIILEPFLKLAADRLFSSVVAILKPLKFTFGKLYFFF